MYRLLTDCSISSDICIYSLKCNNVPPAVPSLSMMCFHTNSTDCYSFTVLLSYCPTTRGHSPSYSATILYLQLLPQAGLHPILPQTLSKRKLQYNFSLCLDRKTDLEINTMLLHTIILLLVQGASIICM